MQRFVEKEHLEIVRKCIKGDRKAQKEVFDSLAGKMMSLCLRYVSDREVAQDMLQDGFVTLFSKMDSYKGDGSFEGWARRIFATTCLMYLRKNDALKMSDDLQEARTVLSEGTTAAQDIGYHELIKMISAMPEGYRVVFNLYVVEGFTHKEISQMLGISEVTSRTQLNRARSWLQTKIKDENR